MEIIVVGNCYGELDGYTNCEECRWKEICDFYNEVDEKAEEAYSLFYADRKEEEDSPPYVEPGTTIEEVE